MTDRGRLEKLRMELRRGVLVLAVLAALREEHYGYSLRKLLADAGLAIDEGTLYPLLRRLEDQGLLVSEWRVVDGRRRRFYRSSPDGLELLQQLNDDWRQMSGVLADLIKC